jgi:hypothetical protein
VARTPDPKLHALWRERVRRQEASGLTIAQFCTQECVARSKFHAWKRRFQLMDLPSQCPTLPSRSPFLPVAVRFVGSAPDESPPIEADLPNGIRLRIPTTNVQLVCRLVRTVARVKTDSGGAK